MTEQNTIISKPNEAVLDWRQSLVFGSLPALVQTNFDWWDVQGDLRRKTAIDGLEESSEYDLGTVRKILGLDPVRNKMTVYTTIMDIQDDIYKTVVIDV